MGYRSLHECVLDLERNGDLLRITDPIDPYLEAAEIQRRAYQAEAPAVLFENVNGTQFPMVCNLFGTLDRTRFLFRDALESVKWMVELKGNPPAAFKRPWKSFGMLRSLWCMWPRYRRRGPITEHQTTLDQLPQLQCWPDDGGAFVTLPEVYTEHPDKPGFMNSNMGMYRVQISGNDYVPNEEIGMHYQIHRSIGNHHAAAIERGEPLRVNLLVGGPPSMILSAVMPLPDGIPEIAFAGAIGRRPVKYVRQSDGLPIYAESDFCISGTIDPSSVKPEGPFGDHLGYYSLTHDFPCMKVDRVYHRANAIWPFTSVGRPPQEDTSFGELIHEITGPAIPTVVPGVHAVHAVDAAGVHPLLLAIGSERYVPYAKERKPQELLTCANAILGQGQLSLAKYLMIVAREDDPELDIHDIPRFLRHLLERVDWTTDLHFQTRTTIDTLDYSGTGFNSGSKVVMAAAGSVRRSLAASIPEGLSLPEGLRNPHVILPGILAIEAHAFDPGQDGSDDRLAAILNSVSTENPLSSFPLIVVGDDAEFAARHLNNFLWTAFTRSNPAVDLYGIQSFIENKHWGCRGSLVIDARSKPHHAPPLIEDPEVSRRVDDLAAPGGPLHGYL